MTAVVATALTACGIETFFYRSFFWIWQYELQQHLPLAVLKLRLLIKVLRTRLDSCNSTYRLRYWNLYVYVEFVLRW